MVKRIGILAVAFSAILATAPTEASYVVYTSRAALPGRRPDGRHRHVHRAALHPRATTRRPSPPRWA